MSVDNFVSLFTAVIEVYDHERMIWNYFKDNYQMLSRKLLASKMNSIITKFANYAVTKERRQEIDSLLKQHAGLGVSQSARRSAMEIIDNKLDWMSKHKKEVGEWLAQNAVRVAC